MEEPIDVWHLNQIEEFLAPNLLSLGLVLNKKVNFLKIILLQKFFYSLKNRKKLSMRFCR
ncbi:unnamed protein product [Meloidogyne enterolobii]|uniref:Uncharacterized protein n=1 Tax=Meloidogyne enterolobii TaxID=390850 RepID=A0ACB0ZR39_MELEN